MTKLFAHRIVNNKINSKETLKKLLSNLEKTNIQGVEFDVRQTKDCEFVAFHDKKFPQLKKKIKNYTLAELKNESLNKEISFLTMDEVIELIPKNIEINIEIKDPKTKIKKFLKIIEYYNILDRLIVSSFYPKIIFKLRSSNIKKKWLLTNFSLKRNPLHLLYALLPVETALLCGATGIAPHFSLINEKIVRKAEAKNLSATVWTINDKNLIPKLKKLGIDYLIVEYDIEIRNLGFRCKTNK